MHSDMFMYKDELNAHAPLIKPKLSAIHIKQKPPKIAEKKCVCVHIIKLRMAERRAHKTV